MKYFGRILWVMLLVVALLAMMPACEEKAKEILPKLIMGDMASPTPEMSEVVSPTPESTAAEPIPSEVPAEASAVIELMPEPAEITPELVEATPEPSEDIPEDVPGLSEDIPEDVPEPSEDASEPIEDVPEDVTEPVILEPVDTPEEIWVLVDISEQHLWCKQGDEVLVECEVVTGLANGRRDTPTGEYAIYAKTAGRYLKGTGYKVWVDYWMAFSGGYGLHDALWRDSFGGTIYQSNGSHGCVNMPHEAAAQLYELVEIGTRVVVQE